MPKTRRPAKARRAKPIGVRVSHKIGGRKSTTSAVQLSTPELRSWRSKCRPRDRSKIDSVLRARGEAV